MLLLIPIEQFDPKIIVSTISPRPGGLALMEASQNWMGISIQNTHCDAKQTHPYYCKLFEYF